MADICHHDNKNKNLFWKDYLNFTLTFLKRENRLNRFEIAVQQRLTELKIKQKMFAPYTTFVIKSLVLVF